MGIITLVVISVSEFDHVLTAIMTSVLFFYYYYHKMLGQSAVCQALLRACVEAKQRNKLAAFVGAFAFEVMMLTLSWFWSRQTDRKEE